MQPRARPHARRVPQSAAASPRVSHLTRLCWGTSLRSRERLQTWVGTGSDTSRVRAFAHELVGLQPDIILTFATPATAAVQQKTQTIPIVFVNVGDPGADRLCGRDGHTGCHRRLNHRSRSYGDAPQAYLADQINVDRIDRLFYTLVLISGGSPKPRGVLPKRVGRSSIMLVVLSLARGVRHAWSREANKSAGKEDGF
jgi:hypothetical protein